MAAGAGATGGIAYLMSGDLRHIAGAIKNLIEDLAGAIQDGSGNRLDDREGVQIWNQVKK